MRPLIYAASKSFGNNVRVRKLYFASRARSTHQNYGDAFGSRQGASDGARRDGSLYSGSQNPYPYPLKEVLLELIHKLLISFGEDLDPFEVSGVEPHSMV